MNVFLEQILHIVFVDRLRYKEMMLIVGLGFSTLQSAFIYAISFRTLTSPGLGRPSITDYISLMNKEKPREVISFAKSS